MILAATNSIWPTVGSILLSLTVTFLFNYFIGLPKKFKDSRILEQQERNALIEENRKRDARLDKLEEAVNKLPTYREQSKHIQEELKEADINILDLCNTIKNEVNANGTMLDTRLKSLENREKNSLREKIYQLWRTFTDEQLNPMLAWTDLEQHSFNELVKDYESLGGNDYVHKVILPDMIKLTVIHMDNLIEVKKLYESRNARRKCVEE